MLKKLVKFSGTDKNIWTTLRLFCIKMFPKAIPIRTAKFEEISPKEIREIAEKHLVVASKECY